MRKNIIGIIPARGGSKGIPRKNIIDFNGKPLIAWSIEQAKQSKYISEVYVSTDSEEIAEISQDFGAKVIIRPDNISGDFATTESALNHLLDCIDLDIDYVVLLQATSPLRKNNDIDNAIEVIINGKSDSLLSVVDSHKFLWKEINGNLQSINYDYNNRKRRQDFETEFQENGSFYICKPEILIKQNNRLGGKISKYIMKQWQQFEIDTIEDIEICETMYNKYLKKECLSIPKKIDLIVYDFDGIMTDNRALINENGRESVLINRSDGLAIAELKKMGITQLILSTEKNNVVKRRAEKLGISVLNGINNKKETLKQYISEKKIDRNNIIYFGNDLNDLEVMNFVGFSVAPKDAYIDVRNIASYITKSEGGNGVIREFYNLLRRSI